MGACSSRCSEDGCAAAAEAAGSVAATRPSMRRGEQIWRMPHARMHFMTMRPAAAARRTCRMAAARPRFLLYTPCDGRGREPSHRRQRATPDAPRALAVSRRALSGRAACIGPQDHQAQAPHVDQHRQEREGRRSSRQRDGKARGGLGRSGLLAAWRSGPGAGTAAAAACWVRIFQ
jgi:hypothetical protein